MSESTLNTLIVSCSSIIGLTIQALIYRQGWATHATVTDMKRSLDVAAVTNGKHELPRTGAP